MRFRRRKRRKRSFNPSRSRIVTTPTRNQLRVEHSCSIVRPPITTVRVPSIVPQSKKR